MKGDVRDARETRVVHTDEACKRMRPHKSERMCLIFGIELLWQVHAMPLVLRAKRGNLVAI